MCKPVVCVGGIETRPCLRINEISGMKFRVFWDVRCIVSLECTDVSELRSASIIRAMKPFYYCEYED
jgi:hypothetical protein